MSSVQYVMVVVTVLQANVCLYACTDMYVTGQSRTGSFDPSVSGNFELAYVLHRRRWWSLLCPSRVRVVSGCGKGPCPCPVFVLLVELNVALASLTPVEKPWSLFSSGLLFPFWSCLCDWWHVYLLMTGKICKEGDSDTSLYRSIDAEK